MESRVRLAELARTFVPPSAFTHSRPRAVELTAAGRALVAVALLFFAGAIATGLGLFRVAERQAANRTALVADSVMVTGEVTRLWPSGDNRRRVAYRFVADGRSYAGDTRVSRERRATLQVGSPIAVRYVPGNPRVHDLGGTPRGAIPLWVPFVVAVGMAAVGVLCLLILERQRQLLIDGRIAPAIVLAHQRHHSGHRSYRTLTFEFPLMSGAVASGKSGAPRKLPPVGSVISVVYDPDRPTRNMMYPMTLVRPAR